ncbi:MAG: hypothetical protein AMJ72_11450 [Acidithiobacillales bacterium SM1_46]|nr:MAG: hypothetical protein AMJ72_11450 [Acidithiobacillales bacterium SM1_46]
MGWTKRDIIEQAFDEIGLAGYVFDLQPQQLDSALRRLDNMMATWNGKGIRIGYALPSSPGSSDLDQESGVTDMAIEAMALNLAIRLGPGYGRAIAPETKAAATMAYKQLLMTSAQIVEQQLGDGTIPSGAGNKGWRYYNDPFLVPPQDPLQAGLDGVLELE